MSDYGIGSEGRGRTTYGIGSAPAGGGGPGGAVNLEQLERVGRRMALMQQWTPDLVTSTPDGALALAEGGVDDDELLRQATEANDFANVQQLAESLQGEDPEVARAMWANLPEPLTEALRDMGFEEPRPPAQEGGGRFGINLPDFLPGPDELTLPDDSPVIGVLGTLQHGGGEALEFGRDVVGEITRPFAWLGQQSSRYWRASQALVEEGYYEPEDIGDLGETWRDFSRAWDDVGATGEGYVRPTHRTRARRMLGGDREAYRMARLVAQGMTPEEIVAEFGFEPQSAEAGQLILQLGESRADATFQEAVRTLSNGRSSFGRTITQGLGFDATDSGFGRVMSGTLDAGFQIVADPTLVAGAVTKGARFGRHAFRLETGADLARGYRMVDLAVEANRARRGLPATGTLAAAATPMEMRRAGQVVDWADRVAEGFGTGRLARLSRDLPGTAMSLDSMANAHAARVAQGMPGLDDSDGVLEWLRSRDGLLQVAGSRLGGGSPLQRGLRIPALTRSQRAVARTKDVWQRNLDAARIMDGSTFRDVLGAVGDPQDLVRQTGQWVVQHTAGPAGRVLAALTAHTPYSRSQRLFGDEAVPEFQRLVNTGIFANMDRSTMDAFVDAFAQGDFVTRANQVEGFLTELFTRSGIADTDFARRFTERHHQAYGLDDPAGVARLVDGHHADAMAIPSTRDFLRETARHNATRWMLHNVPATAADAALSRYWKPSVLMRIGFIPRAAGEELLHFALKHGPTPLLGAKGAEWQIREELRPDLEARLVEAEELGQADEVNRLRQVLARDKAVLTAPLRSLAGAADRMWTRALAAEGSQMGWRQRLAAKAHALDERGVVSGLERAANELSLQSADFLGWMAGKARMPSRGEIGSWMAQRWSPHSVDAARLLLTDPRFARAYTERISGSTFTPDEFRGVTDTNGAPIAKVNVPGVIEGRPVVQEVDLQPQPGEWEVHRLTGAGQDSQAYFQSLYSRIRRISGDRAASRVVEGVLPRWTGSWGGQVATQLGAPDVATARRELNDLWAYQPEGADEAVELDELLPDPMDPDAPVRARPERATGRQLLGAYRRILDDPDVGEGLHVWLGQRVDEAASDLGLSITGDGVRSLLRGDTPEAARRWLAYEQVNPDMLTDDWAAFERQMRNGAAARLSRPDMYPRLREMRAYSDDRMARPVAAGITKVYVPLRDDVPGPLGDDFRAAAARRISMVGGVGQERAQAIADNVAAGAAGDDLVEAAGLSGAQIPLSTWGASDPRVAEAVMAAYEEVTGVRGTFGILEVPDEIVQRAAGPAALGVRTGAASWQVADDYLLEPWRLAHVQPTAQTRRFVRLEVDDEWWDEVELDASVAALRRRPPGTRRLYSRDGATWDETPITDEAFRFVDVPDGIGDPPPDVIAAHNPHRAPAGASEDPEWAPAVYARDVGDGIGEIEALQRVSEATLQEVVETLTTVARRELDNDVLHEVVEPLLRGDRRLEDEAGNVTIEHGLGFDHLAGAVSHDRLPLEVYGPQMVTHQDLRWDRVVSEWFAGPVDRAISSVIRKPMFLAQFGEQLRNQRGLVDLFVEPAQRAAAADILQRAGVDEDELDAVADHVTLALDHIDDDEASELVASIAGTDVALSPADVAQLRTFAAQHRHGLDVVRDNAVQRAIELTTPFLDDHRVRSAFQQYVGGFIPFHFAEEQFIKRWGRSLAESPEMLRRLQLGMNGLRSMGVLRKDSTGRETFVYPLYGEGVEAISHVIGDVFGENLRVPFSMAMTGDVGYTLPGLGDQVGTPSVGPLVAMPVELLSRHHPEMADFEQNLLGPGANKSIWEYFVPTQAARMWTAAFGDVDRGQLASAQLQAIQTMALNGQLPPEHATPAERQEFLDNAAGIARTIVFARGLLGMTSPASPQIATAVDDLSTEFQQLLAAAPVEEAMQAFIAAHPDAEPADLLAATVPATQGEFPGPLPSTEAAYGWMSENEALVEAFPAATPWLLPRNDGGDPFSYRAYQQQIVKGLRKRKTPQEFLDDLYFSIGARDYFAEREQHEAEMLTAVGTGRAEAAESWSNWKAAYFRQHPLFADMLADPTRNQRRRQALEELTMLSSSPDVVPDETAELVQAFDDFRLNIAGLRGDRRQAVIYRRQAMTEEFATWVRWHIERHPHLSGLYLRLIEPELVDLDEDSIVTEVA